MQGKPYWKNICRHFTNGVDVLHDRQCKKGVCYRDVTAKPNEPGSAFRLPCHSPADAHGLNILSETGPAGVCQHFDALTDAEIAEQEAADNLQFAESMRRMRLVGPLISAMKKKYKGRSVKGIKTCPVCGGRLHMSHSGYNGHVWGKCETEACLAWME